MRKSVPKIRLIIILLLTLEVCLGITLIVVTTFYQHYFGVFMTDVESAVLSATFFNTYVMGLQLIASYLCSLAMWNRIWLQQNSQNIQLLLSVWLFFCFLIIVCGCATIWSLLTSIDAVIESAEMILFKGIDMYYMNPEWKLLWDHLQYAKECCGVNNYQDWMHASWLPENMRAYIGPTMRNVEKAYYDNASNQQYEKLSKTEYPRTTTTPECINDDVYTDSIESSIVNEMLNQESETTEGEQTLAPYACCKHDSLSCYKNYVPAFDHSSTGIQHLNLTEINTEGCLTLFASNMRRGMNILFIIILAAIIVDIIICSLTKYLMISNNTRGYNELHDLSMFDEEGNALVVIKCPPKVKCITLEEQYPYDSDIPHVLSDIDPFVCCVDENTGINDGQYHPKGKRDKCQRKNNNYILH